MLKLPKVLKFLKSVNSFSPASSKAESTSGTRPCWCGWFDWIALSPGKTTTGSYLPYLSAFKIDSFVQEQFDNEWSSKMCLPPSSGEWNGVHFRKQVDSHNIADVLQMKMFSSQCATSNEEIKCSIVLLDCF